MAPAPYRRAVVKDKFPALLSAAKTQSYYDPASRGPGSHNIRTIAWNPTGGLIATGSFDKTLRVWNPEKSQVKFSTELRGHTASIEQVAWNPMKEAELASVSIDGTCKFWDVRSKGCVATVQLGSDGLSLSWATDGSMVLIGSRKDETLTPISVPGYEPLTPIPQKTNKHNFLINQTVFAPTPPISPDAVEIDSPKDHTVLTSTDKGTVRITSYTPGSTSFKHLHTLNSHTSSCSCLQLSPNGRFLATGGSDALICLWDTTEWVCRRTLDKMTGPVKNLSFSWDGGYIVGGSDEGDGLEIAHVETGEYVATIPTQGSPVCVAWHPSRYWLAYSENPGGLKIVGAAGGQL